MFTKKSDVFMYGLILHELFTMKKADAHTIKQINILSPVNNNNNNNNNTIDDNNINNNNNNNNNNVTAHMDSLIHNYYFRNEVARIEYVELIRDCCLKEPGIDTHRHRYRY